jgi:hypothetical protein
MATAIFSQKHLHYAGTGRSGTLPKNLHSLRAGLRKTTPLTYFSLYPVKLLFCSMKGAID